MTLESFSIRRELPESGPKTYVGILGVEFLTFEVEFRILVPQTYMENMKIELIFRGCEKWIKNQKDAHGRELQNVAKKLKNDQSLWGKS